MSDTKSPITPLTPAEVDALRRKVAGWSLTPQEGQQLFATVRDRERQRDALQRIINDTPAISQGIQDALAGRVKHLSCVEGGCERDELQRQLAEFKNGNTYSKLGGQLAEVSQERHRLERELAEAQKKADVYDFLKTSVNPAIVRILEHAESCVRSIAVIHDTIDAARERVIPAAEAQPIGKHKGQDAEEL